VINMTKKSSKKEKKTMFKEWMDLAEKAKKDIDSFTAGSGKDDTQKVVEIRAVLNDGPWTEILKNPEETLLKIVHIVYDEEESKCALHK